MTAALTWRRRPSPEVADWEVPAIRPVARPGVVAAVAASWRLRAGLSREWRQRELEPGRPLVGGADLVLVELSGGVVPGFGAPSSAAVAGLLRAVRTYDVPLVLWVTSGGPPEVGGTGPAELLETASKVFVAELLEAWQAVAPAARLLPPAGVVRLPGSALPAGEVGSRATVVAEGPLDPAVAGEVATVLAPAVRPLIDALDVHRVDTRLPASALLPPTLAGAARISSAAEAADAVAANGLLLDGPRRSPGDTWTLLDAAAAGTAVVSLDGLSLPEGFPAAQPAASSALRSEVVSLLHQPELRDRTALVQRRAVVAGHTYSHRVAEILGQRVTDRSVSAVVSSNRPHELDNVLANAGRQAHSDTELVLVLHGFDADHADLRARAAAAGVPHLEIVTAPAHLTLGACLQRGVEAAGGRFVAKLDDDNYYGAHYLTDLVDALDTSGAGIAGKWAHYVWLRSTGAVVLRYPEAEHRWARRIQGGSMLFDADVVRGVGFADLPRAVDSDILDRAIADGVRIWSADRFNFVSVRGSDRTAHTWTPADPAFLTASGRLAFYGDPRQHVEV